MPAAVPGEKMSNVFEGHPWAVGVASAIATAVANAAIGRLKKIFSSPGREDFRALELRLVQQITGLQVSVAQGMQGLAGDIKELGSQVYKRMDEKHDALNDRIDTIVLKQSGGR